MLDVNTRLSAFVVALLVGTPMVAISADNLILLKPTFSIDGGSIKETLIFISGNMYAFEFSRRVLEETKQSSFYCPKKKESLRSPKFILDKMNSKLSGNVTAELATLTITAILTTTYPCSSPK